MQVNVLNSDNAIELSDQVFARDFNQGLVHQLVTAKRAGDRQGTKAQKTRGEVSGSTAKVRQQKGSGRARLGSIKSPLLYHGGVAFAAKPRDYSQKLNKKMYRAGMSSLLSTLLREKRVHFIDPIQLSEPKTKLLKTHLAELPLEQDNNNLILIVDSEPSEALYLSARNLYQIAICSPYELDPADLLRADYILLTKDAAMQLEERLQ